MQSSISALKMKVLGVNLILMEDMIWKNSSIADTFT